MDKALYPILTHGEIARVVHRLALFLTAPAFLSVTQHDSSGIVKLLQVDHLY